VRELGIIRRELGIFLVVSDRLDLDERSRAVGDSLIMSMVGQWANSVEIFGQQC